MNSKAAIYKLLLNFLDYKPQIRLSYNSDEKRYKVSGMDLYALKCKVNINIYDFPNIDLSERIMISVVDQNDNHAFTFGTENLDEVIRVLENSFIDGLLEGLE